MSTVPNDQPATSSGDAAPAGQTLAALALALAPFAWLVQRFNFVTDDAFITFRYSRNFAEGKGLVYNPGVEPPVEGYSEFLWAVLMRLGLDFGFQPEAFSRVLSIAFGAACMGLVVVLAARRFARSPIALFGTAALVGAAPPLGVWATGGMATMPAASLGVLVLWLLYGRRSGVPTNGVLVGVAALLLALMRADAAILVALILGPAVVVGLVARRRDLLISAAVGTLISAVGFGLHVAWRYSFYGDWLPNTARAKLGFSAAASERGLDYVVSTFLSMPGLALAFFGGLVGLALSARRIGAGAALSTGAVIIGVVGYSIAAGGDFMAYSRFLVPAIPMAALAFGALLAFVEARSRIAAGVLALAAVSTTVLAVFDVHLVPKETRLEYHFRHNQKLGGVTPSTSENEQWENMRDRSAEWSIAGRALGEHAPPNASVVFGAVGAIGYFSNLFIYDRNGLVTREVAMREPHKQLRSPGHDKVVPPKFFMKYKPTYLNVGVCRQSQFPPVRGAVRVGPTEREGVILWAVPGR